MSIAADAHVVALALDVLIWILTHEHPSVLTDPMAFVGWDVDVSVHMIAFGLRPSKEVPAHLHIIVGELSALIFIHPKQLRLLARTKVETRGVIDGVGDEQGDGKGPADRSEYVSNLDIERPPGAVDPSTADDAVVDPVKPDDVSRSKQSIENKTEDTSDAVLGQDIEAIVDPDKVFDYISSAY